MVCSQERTKYPFDVQHRSIIPYLSDSPSDFDKLKASLTEKIRALMEQGAGLEQIADASPIRTLEGLSQIEVLVLALIADQTPGSTTAMFSVKMDAERAGVTGLGFNVAIRKLTQKGLVNTFEAESEFRNEGPYAAVVVGEAGWDWIVANESSFVLLRQADKKRRSSGYGDDDPTSDIPF